MTKCRPRDLAHEMDISYKTAWHRLNPEKNNARSAVAYAIRVGRLIKPTTCDRCNEPRSYVEGHHADYSKPLEVEWLCKDCHHKHHEIERNPTGVARIQMKTIAVKDSCFENLKILVKKSGEIQYRLIARLVEGEIEKTKNEQKEKAA